MERRIVSKQSKIRKWIFAVFVSTFLIFWLTGMFASLMAGACRNDRYDGVKKLRFCDIALTSGFWTSVLSIEKAKGAIIHLERGIALSQIGQDGDARKAFDKALRDARSKSGPWEQGLHQRILSLNESKTLALWVSVVKSVKRVH